MRNSEGLTYSEWYAAATFGCPLGRRPSDSTLRAAWRRGEDPCDWAADLAAAA